MRVDRDGNATDKDPTATSVGHPEDMLIVDLTDEQRRFLSVGLSIWVSVDRCTEEMAVGMGFTSVRNLVDVTDGIGDALRANQGLSRLDWARLLIVTSVAFADSLIGGGADWTFLVVNDQESIVLLRSIQHILTRHTRDLIGNGLGKLPEGRNW